jgi:hypothetical protein
MVWRFNLLTCETEGSLISSAKAASLVALAPVSSRTRAMTSSAKLSSGVLALGSDEAIGAPYFNSEPGQPGPHP